MVQTQSRVGVGLICLALGFIIGRWLQPPARATTTTTTTTATPETARAAPIERDDNNERTKHRAMRRNEVHWDVPPPASAQATAASAWASAKAVWGYESPLSDLEMLSSDPRVRSAFATLPRGLIAWNMDAQLKLWRGTLQPLAKEAMARSPLRTSTMYPPLDIAVLWAFVRSVRPRQIIEIGAGSSTTVIAAALAANAEDDERGVPASHMNAGAPPPRSRRALCDAAAMIAGSRPAAAAAAAGVACHVCVEPFRTAAVIERSVVVVPRRVQTLPLTLFDTLGPGDILFIDSSHVLQPYGDTIYELLWILPRLPIGTLVHVHDIFLPDDYPASWTEGGARQYTEQYMLAALLSGSQDWEVIFATRLLMTTHHELFTDIDMSEEEINGGSLWLRKVK